MRVQLRPARLGIVEVAPRQHMDPADARLGSEIAELVDDILTLPGSSHGGQC